MVQSTEIQLNLGNTFLIEYIGYLHLWYDLSYQLYELVN